MELAWLVAFHGPKSLNFQGPSLPLALEKDYIKTGTLKGLSHEIDFKNVDENRQILALLRAAAGF
jgi:hypothetical protein